MRWMLLCLLSLTTWTAAAPPKDLVKVQLLADVKSIKPGSTFQLAVDFTISPGWHIYWLNPGDGGLPTKAVLDLPKGLKADEIRFPVPKTFNLDGGLTAYGYEDHATLLTTIHVADDYKATDTKIGCDAIWLVCKDICVAGKASPELLLPLGEAESDHAETFKIAAAALPMPAWTARADTGEIGNGRSFDPGAQSGKIIIVVPWRKLPPTELQFFPPPVENLTFAKPTLTVGQNETTIVTTFQVLAGQKAPMQAVDSVLSWNHDGKTVGVTVPIHFEPTSDDVLLPTD